ncbi:MAG: class I SAM-dependent methyltransferase [Anaerolineales bacterium]|nr:class I SAM-dependent methyltransferase [Anaerolineales bacterium]
MKIDVTGLTEEQKYELDIYHKTDSNFDRLKLETFYGCIAWEQNEFIMRKLTGKKVLDAGAGYGLLTRMLLDASFEVIAIDPNDECGQLAKKWFDVDVLRQEIYKLEFPDRYFDTVILREVVEHLDFERALKEIVRINASELIIFQSNMNFILHVSRFITRHKEFNERSMDYYVHALQNAGYAVDKVIYRDVIAFPLSGGFVTRQWCPENRLLQYWLIKVDDLLNRFLEMISLQRFFCWRFLIRASKEGTW